MNKINTAPELPAELALTPEVSALAELVTEGSPAWAWQVLAVDLAGPVASTRAPRHQQAGTADDLAQLVQHLGAVSGSQEAPQADLFAETWNEREHLDHGRPAPMFRPGPLGLPRASIASTLIGDTLLTRDGRLWALARLVDHAKAVGHEVPLEAVSVLVAWVVGRQRARRELALSRTFCGAAGENNSGDRAASDEQKEAGVSEVVAELIG